jgi:CRISPR/Cas system-associated endonuclease Cas1
MVVSDDANELGQIDLDGVLAIIITSRGASLTSSLINETGDRNIPVIICNPRFQPVSVITPLIHHSDQHVRYEAQAVAKKGVKNKVKVAVPNYGNVKLLQITDKQFGAILHLGRHSKRSINTDQLALF